MDRCNVFLNLFVFVTVILVFSFEVEAYEDLRYHPGALYKYSWTNLPRNKKIDDGHVTANDLLKDGQYVYGDVLEKSERVLYTKTLSPGEDYGIYNEKKMSSRNTIPEFNHIPKGMKVYYGQAFPGRIIVWPRETAHFYGKRGKA